MTAFKITIFILMHSLTAGAQNILFGVNRSFYVDDELPYINYLTVHTGYEYHRFSGGLLFTTNLEEPQERFQSLGGSFRVNFLQNDKIINGFFEVCMATQIAGQRIGTPVDQYQFTYITAFPSNESYEGYFLKEDYKFSACPGLTFRFKGVELYGSFGFGQRKWSREEIHYEYNNIYKSIVTKTSPGYTFKLGMVYHLNIQKK